MVKKMYENEFDLSFKPAKTEEEYDKLVKKRPKDMICNLDDFHAYIKQKNYNSKLGSAILTKVEESLKFCNGGLGGMYYGVLRDKLTFREFEEFFAHFGIGLALFCIRENQECHIDPGLPNTCLRREGYSCSKAYCPNC